MKTRVVKWWKTVFSKFKPQKRASTGEQHTFTANKPQEHVSTTKRRADIGIYERVVKYLIKATWRKSRWKFYSEQLIISQRRPRLATEDQYTMLHWPMDAKLLSREPNPQPH